MRTITALFVAAQVLQPALASAQEGLREVPSKPPYRGVYGGLNFSLAVPTGEFDKNVGTSPGFAFNLVIPFAASGQVGVLLQTGGLIYGSQSRYIPLSGTGGLVQVKLTTQNWLGFVGGGLQYARRHGVVRPYLNAAIGGSYLFTETSVAGSNDQGDFASTTNLSDWVWATSAGGGLYLPFRKESGPRSTSARNSTGAERPTTSPNAASSTTATGPRRSTRRPARRIIGGFRWGSSSGSS